MLAAACNSSVDLPMPGSPPSKIREPGTTPPPSTRSNSSMPVDRRTPCDISTSSYSLAVEDVENCENRLAPGEGAAGVSARSSTREFHAPHSVQRPIHLGACAPHSWQTKTTFGDFTAHSQPKLPTSNSQIPRGSSRTLLGVGNVSTPWELGVLVVLSFNPRAEATNDLP